MLIVTIDKLENKNYEVLGIVKGSTIQTKNLIKDIGSGLKTLVGGELVAYNEMMNQARALATSRLVDEAETLGADAIIGVRYSSASVMAGAAEIMAYGTAIKYI